jgi:hypothetical protein
MTVPATTASLSFEERLERLERLADEIKALLTREARPPRQWETVAEAAQRVGRSPQIIRAWARRYGIGIMVAGQWQIDPGLLDRLLSDWSAA